MAHFTPQPDGSIALHFNHASENEFFEAIAEQLRDFLMSTQLEENDEVPEPLKRLFPAAYVAERELELQYRRMTRDEMLNTRLEQLRVLEDCVGLDVLAGDQIRQFMQALNVLRLVMGGALDVSEGDNPADITEKREDMSLEQLAHLQFQYLGNLLGELVDAADRAQAMLRESTGDSGNFEDDAKR